MVRQMPGGIGYVEETPMPRLFREAPLNAIWEGSGNVIALDVLRTLRREPAALEAYVAELDAARGGSPALDQAVAALKAAVAGPIGEADARGLCERLALALQGALLVRHAPSAVADAFCARRFGPDGGLSYGALPAGADIAAIVRRQTLD